MTDLILPKFYQRTIEERLKLLHERGLLSDDDLRSMIEGRNVIKPSDADKLIENVIGVFGLPLGLGLNFLINGRDYVVPMVVEEPSIVAAVSSAAKLVRQGGGFRASSDEPLLIGQIQVVEVAHPVRARSRIIDSRQEIIGLANSLQPNLIARSGGVRDLEVVLLPSCSTDTLVVHLLVDTRDAMGANIVNTMCEGVAPLIEKITGGRVFLRILSNLTDRAMVRAEATIPVSALADNGLSGENVRDAIVIAGEFAMSDPYRATTHNKGIMNGIDAAALATGNDWRAIEAAAHAYAGRGRNYTSLTTWRKDEAGNLSGRIELPLKVGTVGGQVQSNPSVRIAHKILRITAARELAEVLGCVGLAQNLAALRALSTEGIQRGHMTLHARSCAAAAGAQGAIFEVVVEKLIASGEIKVWKAREILSASSESTAPASAIVSTREGRAAARGTVTLFGDHSVVYGGHAIAAPIPLEVRAHVQARREGGVRLLIPQWGVEESLPPPGQTPVDALSKAIDLILTRLGQRDRSMWIDLAPGVPRAMGLGGSAAMAVSVIRAVAIAFDVALDDAKIEELAYDCERIAHGAPSGVDKAVAVRDRLVLYHHAQPASTRVLASRRIPLVIGLGGVEKLTAGALARLTETRDRAPGLYERIFAELERLTLDAAATLAAGDLSLLGKQMNVSHGMLNALGLSSAELEEGIDRAREAGALGAKRAGTGAVIALASPDDPPGIDRIVEAIRRVGYRALVTTIE